MLKLLLLCLKLAACFLLFICNPTWLFFSLIIYCPFALSLGITTNQALAHQGSLIIVSLISFFLLGFCFYRTCKSHQLDNRETQLFIIDTYLLTHSIYLFNPLLFYWVYQTTHSFTHLVGIELLFLMIAPVTHNLFVKRLEQLTHKAIDI